MKRHHFIMYAVEQENDYWKYDNKTDAMEDYKKASAPKELYGVDEYGLCHTICKSGKFTWEK